MKKKMKKYIVAANRIIVVSTISTLLSIFCIFIYKYINKINYYQINNINISGNNYLRKDFINKIISEKVAKETIFSIDLEKVRKDIDSHSFINSSNAYLVLPQSLFINVQEINPIALYEENNQIYFIDYYYNLIKADIESINFFNVPIISQNGVINYEYKESGRLIKKIINNSDLLFNYINEIEYSNERIYLKINNKTKIIIDRKHSIEKLDVLFEFMKKINNNITLYKYIDLTIPNQIIVKEKHKTI